MPVIPALDRQRQEDQGQPESHIKLEDNLGFMRPLLKLKKRKKEILRSPLQIDCSLCQCTHEA